MVPTAGDSDEALPEDPGPGRPWPAAAHGHGASWPRAGASAIPTVRTVRRSLSVTTAAVRGADIKFSELDF